MGKTERQGQGGMRGATRPPPHRFVFLKPANDNRGSAGLAVKRALALGLVALLAVLAFWANAGN